VLVLVRLHFWLMGLLRLCKGPMYCEGLTK
jgi:hypothetical protein